MYSRGGFFCTLVMHLCSAGMGIHFGPGYSSQWAGNQPLSAPNDSQTAAAVKYSATPFSLLMLLCVFLVYKCWPHTAAQATVAAVVAAILDCHSLSMQVSSVSSELSCSLLRPALLAWVVSPCILEVKGTCYRMKFVMSILQSLWLLRLLNQLLHNPVMLHQWPLITIWLFCQYKMWWNVPLKLKPEYNTLCI